MGLIASSCLRARFIGTAASGVIARFEQIVPVPCMPGHAHTSPTDPMRALPFHLASSDSAMRQVTWAWTGTVLIAKSGPPFCSRDPNRRPRPRIRSAGAGRLGYAYCARNGRPAPEHGATTMDKRRTPGLYKRRRSDGSVSGTSTSASNGTAAFTAALERAMRKNPSGTSRGASRKFGKHSSTVSDHDERGETLQLDT